MKRLLNGALAGTVATVPMTIVMEILHRWPEPERQSLPPRQITMHALNAADMKHRLNKPHQRSLATLATHFTFGGVAGALYAPLAEEAPGNPALKGIGFAMAVWALSYLGWIPAANILSPATQHSARRNTLMIVAHLVWGACLGILTEKANQKEKR